MRPEDLLPWRSVARPTFVRPTNRPLSMADVQKSLPEPPNPSATELFEQLGRQIFGYPEKILSGEQEQIHTPFGEITYPSGAVDAAAMLPFGTQMGRKLVQSATEDAAVPFFSQLIKTLTERMPERSTPEQILNIARKGSKADELAWSGLEDFLSGKKSVNKADVLRHLEANTPQLNEQMIGEPSWEAQNKLANLNSHIAETGGDEASWNARRELSKSTIQPKFTQYTLPGGENHRELIVTLPPKENAADHFGDWLKQHTLSDVINNMSETEGEELLNSMHNVSPSQPVTREIYNRLPAEYRGYMDQDYRRARAEFTDEEMGITKTPQQYHVPAGHAYGDPELDVNRLFHARMNDRTLDNGEKALLMEELQSDWHQAGRKEGYKPGELKIPDNLELRKLSEDEAQEFGWPAVPDYKPNDWVMIDKEGSSIYGTAPGNLERDAAHRHIAAQADTDWNEPMFGPTGGVPDAPFKTTWHELGMKRMIQEAAQGGYDRLAWTTGEQQAERYNLANHIDGLNWFKNKNGTYSLQAYKDGDQVFEATNLDENRLEHYVGNEVANKIKNGVGKVDNPAEGVFTHMGSLSNLDIAHAGSAGMNGFYGPNSTDEYVAMAKAKKAPLLPTYAKKFGKKYGVEPELLEMPQGERIVHPDVDGTHGEEVTGRDLQTFINEERNNWLENEHEYLRGMDDDEIKEHLKATLDLTDKDFEPAGEYADWNHRDIVNKIMESIDDDGLEDVMQKAGIKERGIDTAANRRLLETRLMHDTGHKAAVDILNHVDDYYTPDMFEEGGDFGSYSPSRLRERAHDTLHDTRGEQEVIDDLLEMGILEKTNKTEPVWTLKITPEMRKDLADNGQSLFSAPVPISRKKEDKPIFKPSDFVRTTNR